jgi:hypothetical protein
MRPVYVCACIIASLGLPAVAAEIAPSSSQPDVTVIVDFKGSWNPKTLQEMQWEASRIIGASGLRLGWSRRGDAIHSTFNDLVVMTFKGSCNYVPAPPTYDELGPYASTRTANGEIQPFGDVDCDRVVNSVRTAMFGGDFAKADILVGRALGRVVAHELVHMLTKSDQHAHEGVQKAALSGKQLIAASLSLSAFDVDRLRLERKLP